jgi:hypothetical protein
MRISKQAEGENTMTPLEHENATATVSISGLALGCYNKATQNYEVGFLRHECHALKIEVTKKLPDGEESIMLYEIKDYQHRIFIDAENAISPQDPIYFIGDDYDDFNRKQLTGDLKDFRWVVDFERNLNGGEPVQLKAPEVPVTEMYISKPRLYADQESMTRDLFNLIPLDAKGNPTGEEKPFGFFAEGIKADINCPPKEASEEENDRDTDSDAEPLDLESRGMKPTDFRLFYSLIEDTAGEKYDVEPANQGEGAVCNIGGLGKSEKLFPVPASSS